jgi:uncharacterized membrane protein YcaP (DUF421 family)
VRIARYIVGQLEYLYIGAWPTTSFAGKIVRVTLGGRERIDSNAVSLCSEMPSRGSAAMNDIWRDMFVLGVPLLEKILRPVIVYAFLVVSLRLSGKRELVQLNPFDLVVLLTLSNTVQNAIIGNDNSVSGGLIGATSLLVINYLVVRFLYDHRKLDQLVEGDAEVLIEDGEVVPERLKKELISTSQLEAAARKQGFDSLAEVRQCTLEPGGTLTFVGKKPDTEDLRHQELVRRMERLMEEVMRLRGAQPPAQA